MKTVTTAILTKNAAKTIFHLTLTILYTGKERLQDPAWKTRWFHGSRRYIR